MVVLVDVVWHQGSTRHPKMLLNPRQFPKACRYAEQLRPNWSEAHRTDAMFDLLGNEAIWQSW
jgi:hypothetical protein